MEKPKVTREFVEKWAEFISNDIPDLPDDMEVLDWGKIQVLAMLQEAGVEASDE